MKLVKESISDILKPKQGDFLKYFTDVEANNKRVKELFDGDLSPVMNLTTQYVDVMKQRLSSIQEIILDLIHMTKFFNDKRNFELIDDVFMSKKYSAGSLFNLFSDNFGYQNVYRLKDCANFLNSNYFDLIKSYLDNINVSMLNPKLSYEVIICELSRELSVNEKTELSLIIKNNTKYFIFYGENNDQIYPMKQQR